MTSKKTPATPHSTTPISGAAVLSPRLQLKTAEGTRHDLTETAGETEVDVGVEKQRESADINDADRKSAGKTTASVLATPQNGVTDVDGGVEETDKTGVDDADVAGVQDDPTDGVGGDIVLGTLAEIMEELRAEVPLDLTPIDKFLGKADKLEERLEPFAGGNVHG